MTAVELEQLERVAREAVEACGGLVGPIESCEMMRIPNSQRGNFHRLAGLPEPLGATRRGQVWLRAPMAAYAEGYLARRAA